MIFEKLHVFFVLDVKRSKKHKVWIPQGCDKEGCSYNTTHFPFPTKSDPKMKLEMLDLEIVKMLGNAFSTEPFGSHQYHP